MGNLEKTSGSKRATQAVPLPVATYEVARNPHTLRVGNTLHLYGKKYACPRLTTQEILDIAANIHALLDTPTLSQRLRKAFRRHNA